MIKGVVDEIEELNVQPTSWSRCREAYHDYEAVPTDRFGLDAAMPEHLRSSSCAIRTPRMDPLGRCLRNGRSSIDAGATMYWKIVERQIGRAGGAKRREARQREWDRAYGESWSVGYVIDGEFVTQEDALESVYYRSYEAHFRDHPEDLEELISLAKVLRNPHAEATTGVDLQVPAIMNYLERHGLSLRGSEVVDIGTWRGERSHAISVRLSPLTIACVHQPKMTLEKFWQDRKCLAVPVDEPDHE